jgi:RNA polymerase sigma-70 factor (ECF subfamily)
VNGNKQSFVYLHEKYQSKVYFYCLKFVGNREVAEEITSDVFVKVWQKREEIQTDLNFSGLLLKITRDFALSYLRRVARNADQRKAFIDHYFQCLNSPVEEQIYLKEGMAIADRAIENLPPKCRQVFRLRYLDGLSLKQIAEELHISTNTVQNHLQKGTHIVKSYLQEHSDLVFTFLVSQSMVL